MATIKAFTDLQQSKKLAEILPLESADMCFNTYNNNNMPPLMIPYSRVTEFFNREPAPAFLIPCWSLAALRNLLPPAIKPNKDSCLFLFESHNTFDKSWVYRYYNEDDTSYLYYKNTNEVDACVAMIEKLNELKML